MIAPTKSLTTADVVTFIKSLATKHGGTAGLSAMLDISEPNIRAVMQGRVKPGKRLAKAVRCVERDGKWVRC